jgi:hypothetical protein
MSDVDFGFDFEVDTEPILFGIGLLVLVVLTALITRNLTLAFGLGFGVVALAVLKKL